MKNCWRCKQNKPLSEFGINSYYLTHGARDGKNIYCRDCICKKMAAQREKLREYKVACKRKPPIPKRKPSYKARKPIPERVLIAINRGATTQNQIWSLTAIPKDAVADALAELILIRGEVKPTPLSRAERESWHGDNWRYEAVMVA